jgi:bacillithiol biosynthesis cysteine-adding enzyme BshC
LNHDAVRSPVRAHAKLTSFPIPFSDLPGQSRLFLDYLSDPLSLKRYYPNAVASASDLAGFIPEVLSHYTTDRARLCDALAEINTAIGNSGQALANVDLLRDEKTVAVVTGQQAGLFTGPLYTIYKALTAIKLADELKAAGADAIPVFWAATEDHDFAEVSKAFVVDKDSRLAGLEYKPAAAVDGAPVGQIKLDASIGGLVEAMFDKMPHTEFTSTLCEAIRAAWREGLGFGDAFEREIAGLFGHFGLVVMDPLHPSIKALSAPIYASAVENADDIVAAIRERSSDLVSAGYHAQVVVEEDYFPLFWHTPTGRRVALKRTGNGTYSAKGEDKVFTRSELADIALHEPSRLSPGVMLRSVVQDHLLPTVCYVGGGAEIAYFAQNSEAYRVLGRPVTPILHRQSYTVVEPRQRRKLDGFGLKLNDLFDGVETNLMRIGKAALSETVDAHFTEALTTIDERLGILRADIASIDPTLLDSLEKRRQKIIYHIESLSKKTYRAQARRDETIERQLRQAITALTPNRQLQERVLNVNNFLNKYGPYFIDWLYETVDVDERDHVVLYI